MMGPSELILAILYAAEGRAPSRVHLQKALFIASKHSNELGRVLEFSAYRMGPWSEEVSDALENLIVSNLIRESEEGLSLTDHGLRKAKTVWDKLKAEDRRTLTDIASFVNSLTEDELLLYVYMVYGYSEKSDIIKKLLRRRKELALSMLRKGVISAGLAAEVAGEPLPKFIKYLRKRS